MTKAQNQQALRKRKAAQGLVRVEVWVPEQYKDPIRKLAQAMQDRPDSEWHSIEFIYKDPEQDQ